MKISVLGGIVSIRQLFKVPEVASMAMESSVADESALFMAKSAAIAPEPAVVWPYVLIGAFLFITFLLICLVVKQKLHQGRLGSRLTKK